MDPEAQKAIAELHRRGYSADEVAAALRKLEQLPIATPPRERRRTLNRLNAATRQLQLGDLG